VSLEDFYLIIIITKNHKIKWLENLPDANCVNIQRKRMLLTKMAHIV